MCIAPDFLRFPIGRAELEELDHAVAARRTLVGMYQRQADGLAAAVADAPGELAAVLAGVRSLVGTCWPDATGAVVHVTGADRGSARSCR